MAATPCGAHHSGIIQPADIVNFTHKTAARWKAHPNALLFGRISAIMLSFDTLTGFLCKAMR